MSIPVVDIAEVLSRSEGLDGCDAVQELHSAFTTVGFVFIKNHGIDKKLIDSAFEVGTQFFTHSVEDKKTYARGSDDNSGYVWLEKESSNPSKPGDLKECFNICNKSEKYPDGLVPSFKPVVAELYERCTEVSHKILEVMGYALKIEDPQYFVTSHSKMGLGSDHNLTTLRLLYYPPLPPNIEIKPGQLRCGEHVDYGSITLLFREPGGGLQVKRCDGGGYIDVPYIADAILVNLGALMQQWTSDTYLATPHRVVIPEEDTKKQAVRRSIAFFVQPDNNVLVECVDGSNKYPPITAQEDTKRRLNRSYN